jgi:hypothetical protein
LGGVSEGAARRLVEHRVPEELCDVLSADPRPDGFPDKQGSGLGCHHRQSRQLCRRACRRRVGLHRQRPRRPEPYVDAHGGDRDEWQSDVPVRCRHVNHRAGHHASTRRAPHVRTDRSGGFRRRRLRRFRRGTRGARIVLRRSISNRPPTMAAASIWAG